jgi:hypothetical protein
MEHWDLRTLDVETRQPRILHSARVEARSILHRAGRGRGAAGRLGPRAAYVVIIAGEVDLAGAIGGPGLAAVFEPAERHAVRDSATPDCCSYWRPGPGKVTPAPATPATFSSEASAPATRVPAWVAP